VTRTAVAANTQQLTQQPTSSSTSNLFNSLYTSTTSVTGTRHIKYIHHSLSQLPVSSQLSTLRQTTASCLLRKIVKCYQLRLLNGKSNTDKQHKKKIKIFKRLEYRSGWTETSTLTDDDRAEDQTWMYSATCQQWVKRCSDSMTTVAESRRSDALEMMCTC